MNREIKFRAWDKKEKKMVYQKELGFAFWQDGKMGLIEDADMSAGGFNEEVEVMQFTGLKDKNGKEIYEGDIVSYSERWEIEKKSVGSIEFLEERFVIRIPWVWGHYPEYGIVTKIKEVIGNIWENEDLLK